MHLYVLQSNLLCQLWCLCNSNTIIFFFSVSSTHWWVFLFMTYLSLAHRFRIHQSTVSHIINTWANFFYTVLGAVGIWLDEETVKAHMPDVFQYYCDTQVILDCTELRCQTPNSLLLQSEVFSTYKSHCTFKGLVGMAPHGAVNLGVIFLWRRHQWSRDSKAVWYCLFSKANNGYYGR